MVTDRPAAHAVARMAAKASGLLVVVLLGTGEAQAESGLAYRDDPAVFLREFSSEAIGVLADGRLNDKDREIAFRRLFTAGFDVDTISRFVLGRYWRTATEQQRSEYRQLFEDFIIETYSRRLNGYTDQTLLVGAVRALGDKGAMVSSQIRGSEGPPIDVDWRLRNKAGTWRIIDIEVEGVSLAVTQRSEFSALISNQGGRVEGLLEKLREKTGRAKPDKPL